MSKRMMVLVNEDADEKKKRMYMDAARIRQKAMRYLSNEGNRKFFGP